jgi:hypothetical protein
MIRILLFTIFFICVIFTESQRSITSWERCREIIQHLPLHPTDIMVEFAVMSCGLYPFLEDHLYEYPTYLRPYCGRGVGMWQYPIQFAKYLNVVRLFEHIYTYVEIGTAAGGTFIFTTEFLRKFFPTLVSVGVDMQEIGRPYAFRDEVSPYDGQFQDYLQHQTHSGFIHGNVHNFQDYFPNATIDLLMIDGDHTYPWIKHDFDVLFNQSRLIVIHDIVNIFCPDVVRFWQEIRQNYSNNIIEFVDQYPDYPPNETFLGIGVLANPLYFDCHREKQERGELTYCLPSAKSRVLYAERSAATDSSSGPAESTPPETTEQSMEVSAVPIEEGKLKKQEQ